MLQLVEGIESTKSEVKKKMMCLRCATTTPKSLQRIVEEIFPPADLRLRKVWKNFVDLSARVKISLSFDVVNYDERKDCSGVSCARHEKPIIESTKICAGAHEWLLSTMLSSFLDAELP